MKASDTPHHTTKRFGDGRIRIQSPHNPVQEWKVILGLPHHRPSGQELPVDAPAGPGWRDHADRQPRSHRPLAIAGDPSCLFPAQVCLP